MPDARKYTSKLEGAKVLIIGGSSGIGYSVVEACLEFGATVIISSSNQSKIDSSIASLLKDYPSAKDRLSGHACNLGDGATLESNVKTLFETAGKLNHVVFTAGDALSVLKIQDVSMDKLQQAGMVRFNAVVMVGKYAPQYLENSVSSSIVITTGTVSQRPHPNWSVVGAYATALHGLTRGLALDLAPIRVNLISPGAVKTPLWSGMSEEQFAAMEKGFKEKSTTGAIGLPEDVAEAFLFAMKDKNCTGTVINSDSGALLK
ncbi:hypothetical protein MMC25_001590 [Agyrium rufum]|nr:hypothetical protein [Agyrium rufum]